VSEKPEDQFTLKGKDAEAVGAPTADGRPESTTKGVQLMPSGDYAATEVQVPTSCGGAITAQCQAPLATSSAETMSSTSRFCEHPPGWGQFSGQDQNNPRHDRTRRERLAELRPVLSLSEIRCMGYNQQTPCSAIPFSANPSCSHARKTSSVASHHHRAELGEFTSHQAWCVHRAVSWVARTVRMELGEGGTPAPHARIPHAPARTRMHREYPLGHFF